MAAFGEANAPAALDLLELMELAWHDCYDEVTPPEDLVDAMIFCSDGELDELVRAAWMAVMDRRDLMLWAQTKRAGDARRP